MLPTTLTCLNRYVNAHLQEYVQSQTVTTKDVSTDAEEDEDLKQYNFGELIANSEEEEVDPFRKTNSSLHGHFVVHTEERPYKCTYCQADFMT